MQSISAAAFGSIRSSASATVYAHNFPSAMPAASGPAPASRTASCSGVVCARTTPLSNQKRSLGI
eukprot:246430-Prorocentrum_minimum.AAC.1